VGLGNPLLGAGPQAPHQLNPALASTGIVVVVVVVVVVAVVSRFYRAKRSIARLCHGKLSVCPSVRLSVTLVDCDHTCWNSSKSISRMISLTFLLSAGPNITDLLKRKHPQILAGIGVW